MDQRWTYLLLVAVLGAVAGPLFFFLPDRSEEPDDPWQYVPRKPTHTDHSNLIKGPFKDGPSVTRACIDCHESAGQEVLKTTHFTWLGQPAHVKGRIQPVALGKRNAINNFCIGIQSNWPACTSCHAGYGWSDARYDFDRETNVDCLVCHDQTGTYAKGKSGLPAEGVDLLAVARSVGLPRRENCGGCHFDGGGGNAVKHGDLDESLYHPPDGLDVHMGKYNFVCTDCHRSSHHVIQGRAFSVSLDQNNRVDCLDCHQNQRHDDQRIDAHLKSIACQTCHIPEEAIKHPTKIHWDWSTAGQDRPEDVHTYLKIKGSFIYKQNLIPEYAWYNGKAEHYLMGDPINPNGPTAINRPKGDIGDPGALIMPFKVHRGRQVYDVVHQYLLQPNTAGKGGFWTEFDWDQALRLGSEVTGQPYSGRYGFASTEMYWPANHMVAPKERSLQCIDCHATNGRMNWAALGYDGDPSIRGGRVFENLTKKVGR